MISSTNRPTLKVPIVLCQVNLESTLYRMSTIKTVVGKHQLVQIVQYLMKLVCSDVDVWRTGNSLIQTLLSCSYLKQKYWSFN